MSGNWLLARHMCRSYSDCRCSCLRLSLSIQTSHFLCQNDGLSLTTFLDLIIAPISHEIRLFVIDTSRICCLGSFAISSTASKNINSVSRSVKLEESISGAAGIFIILNKNAPVLRPHRRWHPVTRICTLQATATRRPLRT